MSTFEGSKVKILLILRLWWLWRDQNACQAVRNYACWNSKKANHVAYHFNITTPLYQL